MSCQYKRLRMKNLWLYVVCNLAVGVSLALPLFLFFRERRLKTESQTPSASRWLGECDHLKGGRTQLR